MDRMAASNSPKAAVVAKRGAAGSWRIAPSVAMAVRRDDLGGGVGIERKRLKHRRRVLDDLTPDALARRSQVALGTFRVDVAGHRGSEAAQRTDA